MKNPYPGLSVQAFAMANLAGTVWSCNNCNVSNQYEANQYIQRGIGQSHKMAQTIRHRVAHEQHKVRDIMSEMSGQASSSINQVSRLKQQISSVQSEIQSDLHMLRKEYSSLSSLTSGSHTSKKSSTSTR